MRVSGVVLTTDGLPNVTSDGSIPEIVSMAQFPAYSLQKKGPGSMYVKVVSRKHLQGKGAARLVTPRCQIFRAYLAVLQTAKRGNRTIERRLR
jgi:hypothetical protein